MGKTQRCVCATVLYAARCPHSACAVRSHMPRLDFWNSVPLKIQSHTLSHVDKICRPIVKEYLFLCQHVICCSVKRSVATQNTVSPQSHACAHIYIRKHSHFTSLRASFTILVRRHCTTTKYEVNPCESIDVSLLIHKGETQSVNLHKIKSMIDSKYRFSIYVRNVRKAYLYSTVRWCRLPKIDHHCDTLFNGV